jgi:phytoene dehydrogenase-like protein
MESYIVIGGGLAGLTAANALAGNGHKVTLLEQSERLGGRAITQQDRGYSLNLGPHALYRGGHAFKTFLEWKIPFRGNSPVTGARAYFTCAGKKYPAFAGAKALFKTRMLGFFEKLELARLLRLFSTGQADPGESMQQWLARNARSERVRELGSALTRVSTYTADLANLSARAAQPQLRSALTHGVLYLDGGWQTLVEGLTRRAHSLGVEIRNNKPVDSLKGLNTSGVILAAPPASIERITGVRLPKLRPVRVACLDIGMRKLPEEAARFALGVDGPFYLSVHSAAAKLAPEGAALVHVAKYLGSEEPDAGADREELEQYADLAIPGWRTLADVVRFLPNLTVTHAMVTREGRPDVDALRLQGVAIAGDWVGPEGMLADAAVSSALRAAGVIQRSKAQAA